MKYLGVILVLLLLVSCHKEEIAIEPHKAGDYATFQAELGQNYSQQIYYSLESNSVVSSNLKNDWDLGFESDPNGSHIILNTSRGMGVHRSHSAFDAITDENGLDWNYDSHTGNLDSTGFGDWSQYSLFVIDLGFDETGTHLGYKKMQILEMNNTEFKIIWGDISATTGVTETVPKSTANYQFTYFKFGGGVVSIAPPDDEYDLIFTQYTHLFEEPVQAYVVTGVLLNRVSTECAQVFNKSFDEVSYNDVANLNYSSNINTIGYEWKEFDFGTSLYTVDPNLIYVVKAHNGYYYKLHFTDFYNDQGIKGFPKIEVQQL